jgi:phosphinothricin acetyltransferase
MMETKSARPFPAVIRLATPADLPALNNIYNHYVLHSTCTYQEEPETIESRQQWFARHGERHPVIVAELQSQIVGWGSLSPYHTRSAYRRTVENSVYVDPDFQRKGIGTVLLKELIAGARKAGHHVIIAVIDADQPASVVLHAKAGFEKVGHMKHLGFKFNRWLDVIYMELLLD